MNLLVDHLPTKIKVNNTIYPIRSDFKTALRIIMAFEDDELTYSEKAYLTIKNIYIDDIPEEDLEEAYTKAIKFLDCGEANEDNSKNKTPKRIYSFSKDGNYIFTGINSTHKLDIEKENLHWWKFMALFMDMNDDCMFSQILYFRKRKMENKLSKEEKNRYKILKDILDLENTSTEPNEEKKQFMKEMGLC